MCIRDRIDLDQIILANVEKIEILKGPGSALYGTEAMGGVINIISKKVNTVYKGEMRLKNQNFDGVSPNFLENPNSQSLSYNISIPRKNFRIDFTFYITKIRVYFIDYSYLKKF